MRCITGFPVRIEFTNQWVRWEVSRLAWQRVSYRVEISREKSLHGLEVCDEAREEVRE
jgi:hypothetical protein